LDNSGIIRHHSLKTLVYKCLPVDQTEHPLVNVLHKQNKFYKLVARFNAEK